MMEKIGFDGARGIKVFPRLFPLQATWIIGSVFLDEYREIPPVSQDQSLHNRRGVTGETGAYVSSHIVNVGVFQRKGV